MKYEERWDIPAKVWVPVTQNTITIVKELIKDLESSGDEKPYNGKVLHFTHLPKAERIIEMKRWVGQRESELKAWFAKNGTRLEKQQPSRYTRSDEN